MKKHTKFLAAALLVVFVFAALVAGCSKKPEPAEPVASPVTPAESPASPGTPAATENTASPPAQPGGLKINVGGSLAFSLQQKGEKFEIADSSGGIIGEVKISDGKVKISGKDGKDLYKIKKKDDGFKIYDPADKELFKIKEKDGGLRVKDASDVTLFKIKPKDSGFKITDGEGETIIGKVKGNEVKSDSGKVLASVEGGNVSGEALALMAIDKFSAEQKAGILVFYMKLK